MIWPPHIPGRSIRYYALMFVHGTEIAYTKHRCRCGACRAAAREKARQRRAFARGGYIKRGKPM